MELKTKHLSTSRLLNVLNRTFAVEFYRMNSGFLLLVATLAFGFLSEVEHKALAQYFVSSLPALAFPVGLWILYAVYIIRFNTEQLQLPQNRFVYNLQFVSLGERLFVTGAMFALQFLPAIAYAAFLVMMALRLSFESSAAVILGVVLASSSVATLVFLRRVSNPHTEKNTSFIQRAIDRRYARPVVQYYVEWLLRTEPLMTVGTKILTGALLLGVAVLYNHESYDLRLLSMAITSCGVANMVLVFNILNLEHGSLAWTKNLPTPLSIRYVRLLAAAVIIVLPEGIILARKYADSLTSAQQLTVFLYLVGLVAFFLGLLHVSALPLEDQIRRSFWIFLLQVVVILFKVPIMLLALSGLATGYVFFRQYYYSFEPVQKSI